MYSGFSSMEIEEKRAEAAAARRRRQLANVRWRSASATWLAISLPPKGQYTDWMLGDDLDPANSSLPREEWETARAEKSSLDLFRLGYRPGGPLKTRNYSIHTGDEEAKELPGTSSSKEPADALQAAKEVPPEAMSFGLSGTCKLILLRRDIAKWKADETTDAIVNFLDDRVATSLEAAAGPDLVEPLCGRRKGEQGRMVFATEGWPSIRASKIIHVAGPFGTWTALEDAYLSTLAAGRNFGVKYIAFPDTPCRTYPIERAARITIQCLKDRAYGFTEIYIITGLATWNAWQSAAEEAWPVDGKKHNSSDEKSWGHGNALREEAQGLPSKKRKRRKVPAVQPFPFLKGLNSHRHFVQSE